MANLFDTRALKGRRTVGAAAVRRVALEPRGGGCGAVEGGLCGASSL